MKPLRPEQKAAIIQGLTGAIANLESRLIDLKKQLEQAEKYEVIKQ